MLYYLMAIGFIALFPDNGGTDKAGSNNWPLRGEKFGHFEGGIRVVGIVHSSLIESPGSVRHGLMHISDWYPTILHLAGGQPIDTPLDGFNTWQMIR